MEEVILHIGTHKTGSTSIQETLAGYDDGDTVYSALGIRQATPILTIFSDNYANHQQWKRRGVYGSELEVRRDEYVSILEKEVRNNNRRRLIISAENIWTLKPREKEKLVSFFQDRGLRLTVVCYVREIQAFMASAFQQTVKGGGREVAPVKTRLRKRLEPLRNLIEEDRFFIRKFDRSVLKNGCVVQDFCDIVGIHPKRIKSSNESMSAAALKLVFLFNRKGPLSDNDRRLKISRNKLVKKLAIAYPGAKPDTVRFGELVSDWEDDYLYLQEQYGITFSPPAAEGGEQSLEAYLTDLSDVDLAPLDELLKKNDVDPECFPTAEDKLTVLYYAILAGFKSKARKNPRNILNLHRLFRMQG